MIIVSHESIHGVSAVLVHQSDEEVRARERPDLHWPDNIGFNPIQYLVRVLVVLNLWAWVSFTLPQDTALTVF